MADGTSAGTCEMNSNHLYDADIRCTAWPIADQALSQEILDLIQQASHYRQLRKGANEGQSGLPYHVTVQYELTYLLL